jgi:hypothetical protein
MTDVPSPRSDINSPTVPMELGSEAVSEHGAKAVYSLAEKAIARGSGRRPLANHLKVLGAIVADLLKGAAYNPHRACFRPMGAGEFTRMDIGYHSFRFILDRLAAASLVQIEPGFLDPVTLKGRVTRISATETLLSELAAFGITPADWRSHFTQRAGTTLVATPIQRRAGSTRNRKFDKLRGKRLPVDWNDPRVIALAAEVTTINEFLTKQTYEGIVFDGLFRGFNNGDDEDFAWDKGGRLYAVGGGYQSIKKHERKLIRINGEATVEVDISASHLTILHGLMMVELPQGKDPYAIPGLDRGPVKRFVTATMGNGKIPIRWPADAATEYAKAFQKSPRQGYTGNLLKDYPIRTVRDRVLTEIPLLNEIASCSYGWAELQYAESNILIDAMKFLMEEGIPSLPIHDSLIVPHSYKSKATKAISDSFYQSLGIEPLIK